MWRTIDIVPSSIRNDPQVQAACGAIDAELEQIYHDFQPETANPSILFWPYINAQVPPLLDVLAWEMHVDVWQGWDGDLSIEEKRTLIEQSIDWHQHKGTKYAVEQMLKTVFRTGYVTEWYQYGGDPYYFRIIVNETIDAERLDRVIQGIYAVKNIRSWLDDISVAQIVPPQILYVTVHVTVVYVNVFIPISTNDRP